MTRRSLGLVLFVALATLVVVVGAATAHPGPSTDSGWWMGGDSPAPADDWMGTHMGAHHGMTGYTGAAWGPSACPGGWSTGMMGGGYGGMMGGGWGMGGSGLWGLGFLWPLLLVGIALAVGYVLVSRSAGTRDDRALDVLRERYARGELSEEEYASRREALQG
ncbi:MAG: SHOCT domain-containing protein [Halobacteriales archaeon]